MFFVFFWPSEIIASFYVPNNIMIAGGRKGGKRGDLKDF